MPEDSECCLGQGTRGPQTKKSFGDSGILTEEGACMELVKGLP